MEHLVIRLGNSIAEPVHWIVWSDSDEIMASGELPDASHLATLPERTGKRQAVVLVPAADVILKQVQLPPRSGAKALAAIPFMLEDELTSDIGDVFFALGKRDGAEQPVVVVAHSRMQTWQALLNDAGLNCEKMLPDVLALPALEDSWHLLELGAQWLVRSGKWEGFQGEQDWLAFAIEHHAKQTPEPLQLVCANEIEPKHLANIQWQQAGQELAMQVLAKGAMAADFTLLQGQYKLKKKRNQWWLQWRTAAVLGVVALLLSITDKSIELYQLSAQNEQLKQQINGEYKRAFPTATRIVNVRSQMTQALKQLEQGGQNASVLVMMSQLSEAFASSKIKPQTLRFDGNRTELRMQAIAADFEALETFKRLAEASGFEVQQGAINNKDDKVIGTLSIRS